MLCVVGRHRETMMKVRARGRRGSREGFMEGLVRDGRDVIDVMRTAHGVRA